MYIENSTKALERIWFPPPEEPAIDLYNIMLWPSVSTSIKQSTW